MRRNDYFASGKGSEETEKAEGEKEMTTICLSLTYFHWPILVSRL